MAICKAKRCVCGGVGAWACVSKRSGDTSHLYLHAELYELISSQSITVKSDNNFFLVGFLWMLNEVMYIKSLLTQCLHGNDSNIVCSLIFSFGFPILTCENNDAEILTDVITFPPPCFFL